MDRIHQIALPAIFGALALYGTAFFDVWTAPGLEWVPTLAELREGDPAPAIAPASDAYPPGVTPAE